jgi:hypothetical protein
LKLTYDKLLSTFAFKIILRRYILAVAALAFTLATAQTVFRFGNRQVERLMWQAREARRLVGQCILPL